MELSIVIISKNDAAGLKSTLQSIANIEADILVYDCGSTDGSEDIVIRNEGRLARGEWECYDRIRFKAAQLAKYDWILMLHTGEVADDRLKESIRQMDFGKQNRVYRIRFKNYFGRRWLRHGEWGLYSHIRLANRKGVSVEDGLVHEKLFLQPGIEIKDIKGYIIHHAIADVDAFSKKVRHDALVSAANYQRKGKKAGAVKILFSPYFTFFKNYIIKLGFLDGQEGYYCARMGALYTFLKYKRLRELNEMFKMPA